MATLNPLENKSIRPELLDGSDHTHTDLFVLTAPDSLSAICSCTDLITQTGVCVFIPAQNEVSSTLHYVTLRDRDPAQPTPPGPGRLRQRQAQGTCVVPLQ